MWTYIKIVLLIAFIVHISPPVLAVCVSII